MGDIAVGRGGGKQQVLALGQAPNGESNDVNHTEPELLLQAINEMKVRVREVNSRRLKFLILHDSQILAAGQLTRRCPRAMRKRCDSHRSPVPCWQSALVGFNFRKSVLLSNLIRSTTADDAEPLLRIRIPSDFLMFHRNADHLVGEFQPLRCPDA